MVDQTFPDASEEVRSTELPAQIVVGPLAVIVGVAGVVLTVIFVTAEVDEQPLPSV